MRITDMAGAKRAGLFPAGRTAVLQRSPLGHASWIGPSQTGAAGSKLRGKALCSGQSILASGAHGQSAKLSVGGDRPARTRAATRRRQMPGASPVCLRKKRLK